MRDDEQRLLLAIYESGDRPRDIIPRLGINHKRAWYLLEKWSRKGWYESGVSLDLGWLTLRGKMVAREVAA